METNLFSKQVINISYPRSACGYLTTFLEEYFGPEMKHIEPYYSKAVTDLMSFNYIKNHDFSVCNLYEKSNYALRRERELEISIKDKDKYKYVIQYRHPFLAIQSFWEFTLDGNYKLNKPPGDFRDFFDKNRQYWKDFMDKWVLGSKANDCLVEYDELFEDQVEVISRVISFLTDDSNVDLSRVFDIYARRHKLRKSAGSSFEGQKMGERRKVKLDGFTSKELTVLEEELADKYLIPVNIKRRFEKLDNMTSIQQKMKKHSKDEPMNMNFKADEGEICIVTPVFNAVNYIDDTIHSVVTQKGDFYLRYHIQDGGSTDGTLDKIKQWERLINSGDYTRCKGIKFSYVSEKDKGMYDAIDKAFESLNIPETSYMGWLNADDIFMPGALQTVSLLDRQHPNVDWLGGSSHAITDNGTVINTDTARSVFPKEVIKAGLCDGEHWSYVPQENTFWRQSLYKKAGGLRKGLRYAGDYGLWYDFAQHSFRAQVTSGLAAFRCTPGQLSSDGNKYMDEVRSIVSFEDRAANYQSLLNSPLKQFRAYVFNIDRQQIAKLNWNCVDFKLLEGKIYPFWSSYPLNYEGNTVTLLEFASASEGATLKIKGDVVKPYEKKSILRLLKDYLTLRGSGLFMKSWYLENYPEVEGYRYSAIIHYLRHGASEGRNPNPLFNTTYYMVKNSDVAESEMNPLAHYYKYGANEGRDPSASFNTKIYLQENPDVLKSGMNPLKHYLKYGLLQGRKL